MSAGLLEREKLEQTESDELELETPVIDFTRLYTLEEFLDLDLPDDDYEYELHSGKIFTFKKDYTPAEHARVLCNICTHIQNYLDKNKSGLAFSRASCTPTHSDGYASFVDPDLSFVSNEKLPKDSNGKIAMYPEFITDAPDLVVEIVSAFDTERILKKRTDTYMGAGVKLLWEIHTLQRYILVQQLGVKRRLLLEPEDELDGCDVLPGFKLQVSKIFEL